MADKETVSRLGCPPLQTVTNTSSILSRPFSPDHVAELKRDCFLWWTSQMIEGDGGLPQGGTSGENIFRLH